MARALVSKTRCCGFESHRACHPFTASSGTIIYRVAESSFGIPAYAGIRAKGKTGASAPVARKSAGVENLFSAFGILFHLY